MLTAKEARIQSLKPEQKETLDFILAAIDSASRVKLCHITLPELNDILVRTILKDLGYGITLGGMRNEIYITW